MSEYGLYDHPYYVEWSASGGLVALYFIVGCPCEHYLCLGAARSSSIRYYVSMLGWVVLRRIGYMLYEMGWFEARTSDL
jgi:hypothetical protein